MIVSRVQMAAVRVVNMDILIFEIRTFPGAVPTNVAA
jgi:hypothetical protein